MPESLRALIIDDEPLAHEVILAYCQKLPLITVQHQCYSPTQALEYLQHHEVDLLFLDINMPMLTGLELLKVLKIRPQVIITSAYQEHALESFELAVTDYLLKPFSFERFLKACSQVLERHQLKATAEKAEQFQLNKAKSIYIKFDKQQVQVTLADISCLEAYGNYVKVWRDGKSQLTSRTLSSFEQQLPDDTFMRVHKSAIINLEQVHAIGSNTVTLKDGNIINIGKLYKHKVQNYLTKQTASTLQ